MNVTTSSVNVVEILLADKLDMEAIRNLAHYVRQYQSVRKDAEKAVDTVRNSNKPHRDARLAALCWMLGNGEQAEGHARKDADHPLSLMVTGILAEDAGKLKEALACYEKAAQKDPASAPCILRRLGVLRKLDRQEEALAMIAKLEREFGDKPNLFFHKGRCLEEMGQYEDALACFEKALALDGDHAESLFHAARVLDLRGDDEEAIKFYKKIGPGAENSFSNTYINLATLYEDNGQYEEAIHCCEMILALDSTNKRARLMLESAESSINMYYSPEETKQSEKLEAILRVPVTDFELSVRSRNCLAKMNIRCLGDLVKRTESEMLAYKNFGETSLREIREMLTSRNLRLGMMREDAATRAAFTRSSTRQREEILSKPIDELELSVRSRKCMDRMGIATIGELCAKSELDLATAKNFGRVSLNEIKKKLQENNLTLCQD